MRILFVSDLETRGGAAIAASRLAAGIAEAGVEVTRLYAVRASDPIYEAATWKSVYAGLPRAMEVAINGASRGVPRLARQAAHKIAASALLRAVAREKFDVLHVHAIHNSPWNHETLAKLDAGLPTVWTFHDHWPFSPESYLFRDARGVERRLKPDGVDRPGAQLSRTRYFDSRKKLRLVANSRDTATRASDLLRLPVSVITYGLPLDLYKPVEKQIARRALRIPEQDFLIGFSSDSNADPVKGFDILERALLDSGISGRGIAMGGAQPREFATGKVVMRSLGRVDNPLFQSLVYSACDLFVVPSRAEALGQVAMESIACGTPVVASNVGGLPDIVWPRRSGFLFEAGNAPALAELLRRLEQNRAELSAVATQCRALAESGWSLRRQAEDYLQVYRSL